ncbi:MAG: hypothetical protein O2779_00500 [Nanoarchaeota archaeon]|nr:hypothetical protein [Nanoarchaeota archaeon]
MSQLLVEIVMQSGTDPRSFYGHVLGTLLETISQNEVFLAIVARESAGYMDYENGQLVVNAYSPNILIQWNHDAEPRIILHGTYTHVVVPHNT